MILYPTINSNNDKNNIMEFKPKTFDLETAFETSKRRQMKKFRGRDSPLYIAVYPAVYIMRIFGFVPYTFSKDRLVPSNTNMIFTLIFFSIYSYNIYSIIIQFLTSKRQAPIVGCTGYIKVICNYITTVYSLLITATSRNKFVQIWNNMQDYDDAVRLLGYPQKEIKTKIGCWMIILMNILLWTLVNQSGMYAFNETWFSNVTYMSVYFGSCLAVYKFIGMTFLLGQRFHHLNQLTKKYISSKRCNSQPIKIDIKTIQAWHNELMIDGENLNALFTWAILLWLANLSIHSVSDLYFIIDRILNTWDDLHFPSVACLGSWFLAITSQLLILHISCDYASTQSSGIGELMIEWQAYLIKNNSLKAPIERSLNYINRKLQFTAAGCFSIELPLIRSIASLVTTYLVILLQLQ
ncbi:hypothetical protein M0804_008323 [Polistes exclamans]|nr:hypothetical protein M0804_008323 [Polistes exclamans]